MSDNDSDDDSIKDFELDSDDESVVENWLDSQETVSNETISRPIELKPIIEVPDNPYFTAHRALYIGLCELDDLNFNQFSINRKEELMKSLYIEKYEPNSIVFEEGSSQMDMYFLLGAAEPRCVGEVEVIKQQDNGSIKILTRLTKGQYFGQKYFLTKRMVSRSHKHRTFGLLPRLSI